MKKVLFWLSCLFILLVGQVSYSMSSEPSNSKSEFIGQVFNTAIDEIERKYHLHACGTGIASPGGPIRQLCLAFQIRGSLSQDDIRSMLVDSAQILLRAIKNNPGIQPFLFTPDFSINHIEVIFYLSDSEGERLYDPEIGIARIANGILEYNTHDRERQSGYKYEFSESYEEALKLLGSSEGS